MVEKTKLHGVLLLSVFLTTLFTGYAIGYSVGYHKAGNLYGDGWQRCINVLKECNDGYGRCAELLEECTKQLKKEEVNYKLKLLEKGYDNGWWSYNWSKGNNEESCSYDISVLWICYSENCTQEQISEFIKQNYTYYDDFSDCYIWRYD